MSRVIIPLCYDHHSHLSYSILLSQCRSLAGIHDRDECLAIVAQACADNCSRPLTLVTGWQSGNLPLTAADLASLPPVIVLNYCLHGFLINEAASEYTRSRGLELSNVTVLDEERSMADLFAFFGSFGQISSEELGLVADSHLRKLRQKGLYGCTDMLQLCPESARDWAASCSFPIASWIYPQDIVARNRKLTEPKDRRSDHNELSQHGSLVTSYAHTSCGDRPLSSSRRCNDTRWKLFGDGAIGARTAALADGFLDGGTPTLVFADAELEECLYRCYTEPGIGAEVAYHAIGELAIEQVLRAYSLVRWRLLPVTTPRLRLEHVQFITLAQAHAAKSLGITLCMQPNFSEDSLSYTDRLTPAQCRANNPFRMLIDEAGFVPGKDLIFGSDGMPSGMTAALQNALFPPFDEQKLTIPELLAGYSADPARGTMEFIIDTDKRLVSPANN